MTTTMSPGATGLQPNEINITESQASYDTMYGRSSAGPRRRSLPPPRGVPLSLHVLHHRLHRTKSPLQEKVAILLTHRAIQPVALFDSINHWANDCPDRRPPSRRPSHTYMVSNPPLAGPSDNPTNEIIMSQSDFDHPTNLRTLVSESWNHVVLDSRASKTVCGSMWLSYVDSYGYPMLTPMLTPMLSYVDTYPMWLSYVDTYVDSLSDNDKLAVAYSDSNNSFRFGDGRQVQSTSTARFPAYLGGKRVFIVSDVVDLDILLLFSRVSIKNAKMNINFEQDTVQALNQELPLSLTQTGHYILPLSPSTQLIQEINQPTFQDTDTVTLHVREITGDDTNVASIASNCTVSLPMHLLGNFCVLYPMLALLGQKILHLKLKFTRLLTTALPAICIRSPHLVRSWDCHWPQGFRRLWPWT